MEKYLLHLSATDASAASGSTASGQNLGRSHDAEIRAAVAAGVGHVIKQGYLMKPAKGSLLVIAVIGCMEIS